MLKRFGLVFRPKLVIITGLKRFGLVFRPNELLLLASWIVTVRGFGKEKKCGKKSVEKKR